MSSTTQDEQDIRAKKELATPLYLPENDVTIRYTLGSLTNANPYDRVGILHSSFQDVNHFSTMQKESEISKKFSTRLIQPLAHQADTYQCVYLSDSNQVLGVSELFMITGDNFDDVQEGLVESSAEEKPHDSQSANQDPPSHISVSSELLSSDEDWEMAAYSAVHQETSSTSFLSDIVVLSTSPSKETVKIKLESGHAEDGKDDYHNDDGHSLSNSANDNTDNSYNPLEQKLALEATDLSLKSGSRYRTSALEIEQDGSSIRTSGRGDSSKIPSEKVPSSFADLISLRADIQSEPGEQRNEKMLSITTPRKENIELNKSERALDQQCPVTKLDMEHQRTVSTGNFSEDNDFFLVIKNATSSTAEESGNNSGRCTVKQPVFRSLQDFVTSLSDQRDLVPENVRLKRLKHRKSKRLVLSEQKESGVHSLKWGKEADGDMDEKFEKMDISNISTAELDENCCDGAQASLNDGHKSTVTNQKIHFKTSGITDEEDKYNLTTRMQKILKPSAGSEGQPAKDAIHLEENARENCKRELQVTTSEATELSLSNGITSNEFYNDYMSEVSSVGTVSCKIPKSHLKTTRKKYTEKDGARKKKKSTMKQRSHVRSTLTLLPDFCNVKETLRSEDQQTTETFGLKEKEEISNQKSQNLIEEDNTTLPSSRKRKKNGSLFEADRKEEKRQDGIVDHKISSPGSTLGKKSKTEASECSKCFLGDSVSPFQPDQMNVFEYVNSVVRDLKAKRERPFPCRISRLSKKHFDAKDKEKCFMRIEPNRLRHLRRCLLVNKSRFKLPQHHVSKCGGSEAVSMISERNKESILPWVYSKELTFPATTEESLLTATSTSVASPSPVQLGVVPLPESSSRNTFTDAGRDGAVTKAMVTLKSGVKCPNFDPMMNLARERRPSYADVVRQSKEELSQQKLFVQTDPESTVIEVPSMEDNISIEVESSQNVLPKSDDMTAISQDNDIEMKSFIDGNTEPLRGCYDAKQLKEFGNKQLRERLNLSSKQNEEVHDIPGTFLACQQTVEKFSKSLCAVPQLMENRNHLPEETDTRKIIPKPAESSSIQETETRDINILSDYTRNINYLQKHTKNMNIPSSHKETINNLQKYTDKINFGVKYTEYANNLQQLTDKLNILPQHTNNLNIQEKSTAKIINSTGNVDISKVQPENVHFLHKHTDNSQNSPDSNTVTNQTLNLNLKPKYTDNVNLLSEHAESENLVLKYTGNVNIPSRQTDTINLPTIQTDTDNSLSKHSENGNYLFNHTENVHFFPTHSEYVNESPRIDFDKILAKLRANVSFDPRQAENVNNISTHRMNSNFKHRNKIPQTSDETDSHSIHLTWPLPVNINKPSWFGLMTRQPESAGNLQWTITNESEDREDFQDIRCTQETSKTTSFTLCQPDFTIQHSEGCGNDTLDEAEASPSQSTRRQISELNQTLTIALADNRILKKRVEVLERQLKDLTECGLTMTNVDKSRKGKSKAVKHKRVPIRRSKDEGKTLNFLSDVRDRDIDMVDQDNEINDVKEALSNAAQKATTVHLKCHKLKLKINARKVKLKTGEIKDGSITLTQDGAEVDVFSHVDDTNLDEHSPPTEEEVLVVKEDTSTEGREASEIHENVNSEVHHLDVSINTHPKFAKVAHASGSTYAKDRFGINNVCRPTGNLESTAFISSQAASSVLSTPGLPAVNSLENESSGDHPQTISYDCPFTGPSLATNNVSMESLRCHRPGLLSATRPPCLTAGINLCLEQASSNSHSLINAHESCPCHSMAVPLHDSPKEPLSFPIERLSRPQDSIELFTSQADSLYSHRKSDRQHPSPSPTFNITPVKPDEGLGRQPYPGVINTPTLSQMPKNVFGPTHPIVESPPRTSTAVLTSSKMNCSDPRSRFMHQYPKSPLIPPSCSGIFAKPYKMETMNRKLSDSHTHWASKYSNYYPTLSQITDVGKCNQHLIKPRPAPDHCLESRPCISLFQDSLGTSRKNFENQEPNMFDGPKVADTFPGSTCGGIALEIPKIWMNPADDTSTKNCLGLHSYPHHINKKSECPAPPRLPVSSIPAKCGGNQPTASQHQACCLSHDDVVEGSKKEHRHKQKCHQTKGELYLDIINQHQQQQLLSQKPLLSYDYLMAPLPNLPYYQPSPIPYLSHYCPRLPTGVRIPYLLLQNAAKPFSINSPQDISVPVDLAQKSFPYDDRSHFENGGCANFISSLRDHRPHVPVHGIDKDIVDNRISTTGHGDVPVSSSCFMRESLCERCTCKRQIEPSQACYQHGQS